LSNRFTSVTFDAFTKGLVDRFLAAIPADWRPTERYDIDFPPRWKIEKFLAGSLARWPGETPDFRPNTFESRWVGAHRLPVNRNTPKTATEFVIQCWWDKLLRSEHSSKLTFVALNRLAELLLRAVPHVKRALQLTYPFVFVDEFQDTTYAQYDFLLSAFSGGAISVTAVGDNKQRIMTWAGARIDAFEQFSHDFNSASIPLLFNFRSSPELVQIQHFVAKALDQGVTLPKSQSVSIIDGDVAQVWCSTQISDEMEYLASWLVTDMRERGNTPRHYAILVKQRADIFENNLAIPLLERGIRVRNESKKIGQTTLQDLLSDDFSCAAIAMVRLGTSRQVPRAWELCVNTVRDLRAVPPSDDVAERRVESEFESFLKDLRKTMKDIAPTKDNAHLVANKIVDFLGLKEFSRSYVQYSTGDLLEIMVEAFCEHLAESAESATSWEACVNSFEGVDQVPLMTVHKSKGLEYDTIVFLGLDDQTWWSHTPGNVEGLATFFVALSRAKQRAIFTFCSERGGRVKVDELFQLLTSAGVPEINLT
jgi:superfamily I DNA/RNA helicase